MRPQKRIESVVHRRHDRDNDQKGEHLDASEVELIGMTPQELLATADAKASELLPGGATRRRPRSIR